MDTAVALVQAYLHVNGYFTVTEYPVMEAAGATHARTVTDLDVLAFRFAGAGHDLIHGRRVRSIGERATDPALRCPTDRPDMIVGEVKAGAARFNRAMRDPGVLSVALTRFGCCPPEQVHDVTAALLLRGSVTTEGGHGIRLVAFGDGGGSEAAPASATISMRHLVQFLQMYLRQHWDVLRHAQITDPALGVLALIEKWGVEPPRRKDGPVRMRRHS
jgi:hypothetical protein